MFDFRGMPVVLDGSSASPFCASPSPNPLNPTGATRESLKCVLHVRTAAIGPVDAWDLPSDGSTVPRSRLRVSCKVGAPVRCWCGRYLVLWYTFDKLHFFFGPACSAEIIESLGVDRKKAHRGAIFRRHVCEGGPIGKCHLGDACRQRTRQICPRHPQPAAVRSTVKTRSVAVVPGFSLPTISNPTTSGNNMYIGCPSMAASASIPPTPQPKTPSPLIMVVWLSVPTSESGTATGPVRPRE